MLEYRKATLDDVKDLSRFTDWWLAGRGFSKKVPGAVNDCFISRGQHKKYIEKYTTWVVTHAENIVAWAVVQHGEILIHLLVDNDYRCTGIGSALVKKLSPRFIRSKLDQSSGDPTGFYEQLGYEKIDLVKSKSRLDIDKISPFRKPNIYILERINS